MFQKCCSSVHAMGIFWNVGYLAFASGVKVVLLLAQGAYDGCLDKDLQVCICWRWWQIGGYIYIYKHILVCVCAHVQKS